MNHKKLFLIDLLLINYVYSLLLCVNKHPKTRHIHGSSGYTSARLQVSLKIYKITNTKLKK